MALNGSAENITISTDLPSINVSLPWPPDDDGSCQVTVSYSIVASIASVVCFLFGVLYTFFGYRCFKAILFLMGFTFGTVFVFMILEEQELLPPEGTLAAALGTGVLLGLLTMLLPVTGLFLTGFSLGFSLAAGLLVVVDLCVADSLSQWVPLALLLALGLVLGAVSLRYQKACVVAGTSAVGAALTLAGLDYFLEQSRAGLYLWDRLLAHDSRHMCWFSWLVLGLWPPCALLGILLQWKVTGADMDHTLSLKQCREESVNLQTSRSQQRRETQQTRYRHLYQARRVQGDVVSQNFIQSIQHKLSPAMQSLTALNVEGTTEEESMTTVHSNIA